MSLISTLATVVTCMTIVSQYANIPLDTATLHSVHVWSQNVEMKISFENGHAKESQKYITKRFLLMQDVVRLETAQETIVNVDVVVAYHVNVDVDVDEDCNEYHVEVQIHMI